jgi:hypothetical protein
VKKNNLFLFISILTSVILLGTAATCNMCGLNLSTETTTSTVVDTEIGSTSTEATESKETVAEATGEETVKDTSEKESIETDKVTATESKGEAPTIKLQIYEGPTYSQTDDVCYYRVEAIVTGSPAPTITFSKDDSSGSFGSKKVQVNLSKSSPNYTLTAKAKNSAGEATASIDLSWGCTQPQPVEKTVDLHPSIFGTVGPNGFCDTTFMAIGDSQFNTDWRGRFAFDLSTLKGKEIKDAKLILKYSESWGGAAFKGDIVVNYNDFLPDLTASDYNSLAYAPATQALKYPINDIVISDDILKNKVKERTEAGEELQFGIGFTNAGSDNDGEAEGMLYYKEKITLTVTYLD